MAPPVADSTKTEEKKQSPRRINKPLIEKRRRARINDCLAQLKAIVLEATDTQSPRPSKLEKADILEMTVDFIKRSSVSTEAKPDRKDGGLATDDYMDGYTGCLTEITQFLEETRHVNTTLKTDIIQHVSGKIKDRSEHPSKQRENQPENVQIKAQKVTVEQKLEVKCSKEISIKPAPVPDLESNMHKQSKPSDIAMTTTPRPTQSQTQSTTPVGLYCGGQVLLLLQLPATQQVVTSQQLATPTCNVLQTTATSANLPFITTTVPPNNLAGIPNYIRELNLAGPANFPLISLAGGGSVLSGVSPQKVTVANLLQQAKDSSVIAPNLTGLVQVPQHDQIPNGDNENQSDSPWRPW